MSGDFERDLAAALDRAAARAPLDAPEWIEPVVTAAAPTSTARVLGAAAVVAALVGGTTALVVTRVDDTPAVRTVASTPAEPEGTEVPLEPVDVGETVVWRRLVSGPIKPGSVSAAQVDDAEVLVFSPATWPGFVGASVQEQRCLELRTRLDSGLGLCSSEQLHHRGPQRFRGWIVWPLVPENVEFVSFELGDDVFWQRPYAGMVAVPDRPDDHLRVRTVDSAGEEATRLVHDPPQQPVYTPPEPQRPAELHPGELNLKIHNVVNETVSRCLDGAGLGEPLAPIPSGVDVEVEWNLCLHQANFAVSHVLEPPPPRGTEVPLSPAPMPDSLTELSRSAALRGPVRPGSVRSVHVDDTTVVAYASLTARGEATIAETRCATFASVTGCTLAREPGTALSMSASTWAMTFVWVPDDVEYVAFEFDEDRYWQRPIDGFTATPNQQYEQLRVVAIGAGGEETIVFEDPPATIPAPDVSDPPVERVPVTAEVEEVAFGAAQACLDEAGLGDPFAPVPEGVDADVVWNECVAAAAAAVEDFLAAPPATSTP